MTIKPKALIARLQTVMEDYTASDDADITLVASGSTDDPRLSLCLRDGGTLIEVVRLSEDSVLSRTD